MRRETYKTKRFRPKQLHHYRKKRKFYDTMLNNNSPDEDFVIVGTESSKSP